MEIPDENKQNNLNQQTLHPVVDEQAPAEELQQVPVDPNNQWAQTGPLFAEKPTVDSGSEELRSRTFTDLVRNRVNHNRQRKMSRGEEEVRFWGAAAVLSVVYPIAMGALGGEHQSLEVAKNFAELEGLLGLGALQVYGAVKWARFFNQHRQR